MRFFRPRPVGASVVGVMAGVAFALSACGGTTTVDNHIVVKAGGPAAKVSARFPVAVAHPAAGRFHADATTLATCSRTDFHCYEQAFGNMAFRQGPKQALAVLTGLLAKNVPAVQGDCHTITHLIGSATLARYHGDAAAAMSDGSTLCGSGFYHGLIEYALQGAATTSQLDAKVKSMCTDRAVLKTTFSAYQCIHGLGHGLMIFSADQLPWALSMCDKLGDSWSEQSCSGGVFMQNFNPPDKLSPFQSTFVKKNDLLYPCDWIRAKYKYYCYLQVTEHILLATNYDWRRTAAVCSTAPAPWDGICFQSFGRDASGNATYHPRPAYAHCRLTGTHLPDCVYGVARDFTNNDVGGARAAVFCSLPPVALRGYCFYAIGTILGTFGHDRAWLQTTCRGLSADYAPECEGSLTDAERKLITTVPT